MQVNFSQKRIGVLGGGQLARMLTLQGHKLGLQVHVLSENENDPAAQVTHFWHKGHLNVHNDLKIFLKHVDVATFESEFIDGLLLHEIGHEISTPVHPRPMVMNSLRDRLKQKNLLKEHLLPHTKFVEFDVSCSWSSYKKIFPKGTVIKQNLFGYDGYGTFFVHTPNEHKKFIEKNYHPERSYIIEAFTPFKRELSLICCRNVSGQFITFPLAETFQKNGRCVWVKGPVHHKQQKQLINRCRKFLEALNYVGIMAFELFDTGKEILINELAPRVHNSGHHSLNSMNYDQFSYHLFALLDIPLPKPQLLYPGFAMANLLGGQGQQPHWKIPTNAFLHWYGKNELRPNRKMGHLNSVAKSPQIALNQALKALGNFQL